MENEANCAFINDDKWFRYRAAAIIVEDGCVLLAGNEKEDYLYSVGGAVHHGETAEEAVKREVFEETGVEYAVDHLAVIHGNFLKVMVPGCNSPTRWRSRSTDSWRPASHC